MACRWRLQQRTHEYSGLAGVRLGNLPGATLHGGRLAAPMLPYREESVDFDIEVHEIPLEHFDLCQEAVVVGFRRQTEYTQQGPHGAVKVSLHARHRLRTLDDRIGNPPAAEEQSGKAGEALLSEVAQSRKYAAIVAHAPLLHLPSARGDRKYNRRKYDRKYTGSVKSIKVQRSGDQATTIR